MIAQQPQEITDQKRAIAAAQDRLDAENGWNLMRQLDAKHFEQGYLAAQIGLGADNAGLYSPAHRRGYAAARAGQRPQFVNVGGLPALLRQ